MRRSAVQTWKPRAAMSWKRPLPLDPETTERSWLRPRAGGTPTQLPWRPMPEQADANGTRGSWKQSRAGQNGSSACRCCESWMRPTALSVEAQTAVSSDQPSGPGQGALRHKAWTQPTADGETGGACDELSQAKPRRHMGHMDLSEQSMILAHTRGDITKYAKSGKDPKRINKVLKEGACTCTRRCASLFTFDEILGVCQVFHSMYENDQMYMLTASYRLASSTGAVQNPAVQSPAVRSPNDLEIQRRTQWSLCGKEVCVPAWCSLMGVGPHKVYKLVGGLLDMRRRIPGDDGGPVKNREANQSRTVDCFFLEVYQSAAEALPEDDQCHITGVDQSIERGRGADALPGTGPQADNDVDLKDWDPDRPIIDNIANFTGACTGIVHRWLPHGTLMDLWWQFLAWCSVLSTTINTARESSCPESSMESSRDEKKPWPSWMTFWRRWTQVWSYVLTFRKSAMHADCNTCFKFREAISRPGDEFAHRYSLACQWRAHLRDQYHDRLIYWSLRWASRAYKDVLVIIIDSMDKSKVAWPQYTFSRKPHELDGVVRPRIVITAAIAHGWCTCLYLADDVLSHGASAFCEVLCRTIEEVHKISARTGRPLPRHLYVQSDNTTAQVFIVGGMESSGRQLNSNA